MQLTDTSQFTLSEKIGQLFHIGIPGPELDARTRELLLNVKPGGVCLFARNIKERQQVRQLTDALTESLPAAPIISVDQEGGLVDRLRRIMTPMPAANRIRTIDQAAEMGCLIGETLRILGFNMDFAPVVDVATPERASASNGINTRTFGGNAPQTTELAGAFLDSLQDEGILGCLKHFPGLGASSIDSHEALPEVIVDRENFDQVDLAPYRDLITASSPAAVMVAHAAYPRLDLQETASNGKLLPSSLSFNFVTTLLRDQLHFEGLILTDDLEMGAIINEFGIDEACRLGIAAGVDMLAICADPDAVLRGYEAIISAVSDGTIKEERIDRSLGRIQACRERIAPPVPFDDSRLAVLSDGIVKLNASL